MISIFWKRFTLLLGSMCLYGCGEQQYSVGVSLGGTGEPTLVGGGLPISPRPSVDDSLISEPRYVIWAPDAHTQECDGLDISVHVVNQSTQQILPAGYGTDLTPLDQFEHNNLQLEVHITNISETLIEQSKSCQADFYLEHDHTQLIQAQNCQSQPMQYLPQQTQILELQYNLPYQQQIWQMNYQSDFILNGQSKICHIQAIPFVIEKM